VGDAVVSALRRRGLPVRALVRSKDEKTDAVRASGAEVVVGDLTRAADVLRALAGCKRMYFGMSVSASYLEATVITATAAREHGNLEVFVNISQMTVSQMSLTETTDSRLVERDGVHLPSPNQEGIGGTGRSLIAMAAALHDQAKLVFSGVPGRRNRQPASELPVRG
jgi:hypothetical protein